MGTTYSEAVLETQKEVSYLPVFPPDGEVMGVGSKGEQQGLLKLVCSRKTQLPHHWILGHSGAGVCASIHLRADEVDALHPWELSCLQLPRLGTTVLLWQKRRWFSKHSSSCASQKLAGFTCRPLWVV